MEELYVYYKDLLEVTAAQGKNKIASDLRMLILKNFPGKRTLDDMRAFKNGTSVASAETIEKSSDPGITFSPDDFGKKKAMTPDIKIAAETSDKDSKVNNQYKAILEMDDDTLREKFAGDHEVALDFINKIRVSRDQNPITAKSFSKTLIAGIRATLNAVAYQE